MIIKIRKALREIPAEVHRFTKGQYPEFILERNPEPFTDRVPVFVMHTSERDRLAGQLEFLRTNGYRTLTLKDFAAFLAGNYRLAQPSVVLTMDDGDRSWHDVAYPLLKQYGFTAVGFVVTRYILDAPENVGRRGWLSWPEILEIEQSGVIDFQSHGHYHDNIFVAPELVDFFRPDYPADTLGLDIPWTQRDGAYTNEWHYGTPIYRFAPSMAGHLRYIEESGIRDECVQWVDANGGPEFFLQAGWRRRLKRFHDNRMQNGRGAVYEIVQERQERLVSTLVESKRMLETKLKKNVLHFCYPWGAGCELTVSLSKEAGYQSNFWTSLPDRTDNSPGDSPFYIPRIKDDYLMRLPGAGRVGLFEVFANKAMRRAHKMDIY